jgi:hypothetical protein
LITPKSCQWKTTPFYEKFIFYYLELTCIAPFDRPAVDETKLYFFLPHYNFVPFSALKQRGMKPAIHAECDKNTKLSGV